MGHAEVEPVFETVRNQVDQLGAEFRRRFVIGRGERGCSETRQGGLRVRPQRQQFFRIIAHRIVILARDLERDHIGQRLFGAWIFFQQFAVQIGGFIQPPALLQSYRLAEQHFGLLRLMAQMLIESFESLLGIFQMEQADP